MIGWSNYFGFDVNAVTSYCLNFIHREPFLKIVFFSCVVSYFVIHVSCFIFIVPSGFFPLGLMGDQKKVCCVEEKMITCTCILCFVSTTQVNSKLVIFVVMSPQKNFCVTI